VTFVSRPHGRSYPLLMVRLESWIRPAGANPVRADAGVPVAGPGSSPRGGIVYALIVVFRRWRAY